MIPGLEDLDAAAREWDALADRCAAGPFHRPGWFAAFRDAFLPDGRLALVTVRDGAGALRAAVPLAGSGRDWSAPTNSHTPWFGPVSDGPAALAALATALSGMGPHLRLRPLDGGDPVRALLRQAAGGRRARVHEHVIRRSPYRDLGDDGPAALVSRGLRKEIARGRRRLEESGDLRLEIARSPEDGARALEDLLAVEALGWKGEGGSAIASEREALAFYRGVTDWAARTGRLRLAVLRLGDRPVAGELDLCDGDVLYSLKMGFDPEFRKAGPGHLLVWLLLEELIPEGVRRYEMLGEDDAYKMRWTDTTREIVEMSVYARSPGGLAAFGRQRVVPALGRRVRALADRRCGVGDTA